MTEANVMRVATRKVTGIAVGGKRRDEAGINVSGIVQLLAHEAHSAIGLKLAGEAQALQNIAASGGRLAEILGAGARTGNAELMASITRDATRGIARDDITLKAQL